MTKYHTMLEDHFLTRIKNRTVSAVNSLDVLTPPVVGSDNDAYVSLNSFGNHGVAIFFGEHPEDNSMPFQVDVYIYGPVNVTKSREMGREHVWKRKDMNRLFSIEINSLDGAQISAEIVNGFLKPGALYNKRKEQYIEAEALRYPILRYLSHHGSITHEFMGYITGNIGDCGLEIQCEDEEDLTVLSLSSVLPDEGEISLSCRVLNNKTISVVLDSLALLTERQKQTI